MGDQPVDEMDLTAAATAMAQRSAFIRSARTKAGKDPDQVHDPVRAASSRIVDGKEQDTSRGVPSTPSPAAQEPAPSGGDTTATPKSTQTPAAPVPETVRFKVGDKELEMPIEMLGPYFEKAQRADAAIAEAETMKKVKVTDDALALGMVNWAKTATPAQRQQVEALLRGERQAQAPVADELDGDTGEQAQTSMPNGFKEELMPYLQVTEQLLAREKARDAEKAEQSRNASVDALMGKFEVFKDAGLKGLALRSIKNALAAEPEADVTQVVANHAAEYGNFHKARLASKAAGSSASAATPDPKDPGAASRPALNGRDLQRGGVLAAVQQFLRSSASR